MKRAFSFLMLFVLFVSLFAFPMGPFAAADDPEPPRELPKVTVTLDRTPVVLLSVSESHGAVSYKDATFVSMTWFDPDGNPLSPSDTFEYKTYRVEIRAMANEGCIFAQDLRGYLNNSAADVTVSPDGKYATVSRSYEALVYAPRVIKHPGAEPSVDEGGWVSYVSTAAYSLSTTWEFVSPDGKTTLDWKDIPYKFPSVNTESDGVQRLNIYNISRDLDGWSLRAVFKGAMDTETRSNPVTIAVKVDPSKPAATPEPEETPAPTEAPEAIPEPEATPEPAPTEDEPGTPPDDTAEPASTEKDPGEAAGGTPVFSGHEHSFAATWVADENEHWHDCPCGERDGQASHSFRWKTTAVNNGIAAQEGVCTVCGYRTARDLTVNDGSLINKVPMRIVIPGALGVMAVLVIAEAIKRRRG